mmetsp:Transcript_35567/g.93353  ORF Transcript_35567/g.93353 Transcript_35567/m.93353 type:complete len:513 (+) Transcript_35567:52-1590(+)
MSRLLEQMGALLSNANLQVPMLSVASAMASAACFLTYKNLFSEPSIFSNSHVPTSGSPWMPPRLEALLADTKLFPARPSPYDSPVKVGGMFWSLIRSGQLFFKLCFMSTLSLLVLPMYLLGLIFYGRSPTAMPLSQALLWVGFFCEHGYNHSGPYMLLQIAVKVTMIPSIGCFWYLDNIINRGWDKKLYRPIFMISAGRSGSTETGRLIAESHGVVSPAAVQLAFPLIILWNKLLGEFRKDPVKMHGAVLPGMYDQTRIASEFATRHEINLLETDTAEPIFGSFYQFTQFMAEGGDELYCMQWSQPDKRLNPTFWNDFTDYLLAVMKKTVYYEKGSPTTRCFVKGHFVGVGADIEARCPDASFVTSVRPADARAESYINHLYNFLTNCNEEMCPYHRWPTLARAGTAIEVLYTESEARFYLEKGAKTKRVIYNFTDFTNDPNGTLKAVLEEIGLQFDAEKAEKAVSKMMEARKHRPIYQIDRKLEELGVSRKYLMEIQTPVIDSMIAAAITV